VTTVVRWYLESLDMWCYAELDEAGWAVRFVEQRQSDDVFFTAASRAEELHARDTGGLAAMMAHGRVYGYTPEAAFDNGDPGNAEYPTESITADAFEEIWRAARRAREAGEGVVPL
jgi:hypothetical protein